MKPITGGRIVILGAGPTGLGAAHLLHRLGFDDWVLFEREHAVGGLSKSVRDEHGFTWDLGGHVVFSHYALYTRLLDELLGPSGWIEHRRESWIRLLNTWVPYPFQNNVHRLPPAERAQCLEGLVEVAGNGAPRRFANLEDFILGKFGRGIAELFMLPYNFKVWAYPPSQLDAGWIADRVSVPDPAEIVRAAARNQDDVAWGPNRTFRFPKRGGNGAIWEALASRLPSGKIVLGCEATHVDAHRKKIRLSNGKEESYETLISTIPLDHLARISGQRRWIQAVSGLKCSATYVIGVGLHGRPSPELETKCWMYFPEDNAPFYRVTHFSRYSPNNVDDIAKRWSLICEVSESPEKPVDRATVVSDTIRGLVATGLIENPDRIHHTWMQRLAQGYPTPSRNRDALLNELLPELAEKGILSRGRFGAWRYEVGNQDHSFMQGYEAAAHALVGTPELTVWEPELVNTRHPVLGWDRFR